jgi:hypothetical protein
MRTRACLADEFSPRAVLPSVWRTHPERRSVPRYVDGEWAMQDARRRLTRCATRRGQRHVAAWSAIAETEGRRNLKAELQRIRREIEGLAHG